MLSYFKPFVAASFALFFCSYAVGDPPSDPTTGSSSQSLQQEILQKQHELAEHEYESALRANERIPRLNSKQTLLRLKQQMEYTAVLVESMGDESNRSETMKDAMIELVENDAEMAQKQLQWAQAANRGAVAAVPEDQMRQYELTADLAELTLRRAKQDDFFADPTRQLQWQINRLRQEVLRLQTKVERTQASY